MTALWLSITLGTVAALADYLGFLRPERLLHQIEQLIRHNVYEQSVVFLKNLGFVTPTEARRISYEETVRFEQIHERVYRDFGFQFVFIEPGPVSKRVEEIKRALSLDVPT